MTPPPDTCRACDGSGEFKVQCNKCDGQGDRTCNTCVGSGHCEGCRRFHNSNKAKLNKGKDVYNREYYNEKRTLSNKSCPTCGVMFLEPFIFKPDRYSDREYHYFRPQFGACPNCSEGTQKCKKCSGEGDFKSPCGPCK